MLAIGLSLSASIFWGGADFFAGLKSRKLSVVAVLLGVETSGLIGAGAIILATGEPLPGQRAAIAAVLAGTAGVFALGAFYRALAIGTMSIVAPISATGVALPVIVGVGTGDALGTIVAIGIAVTVGGVILASRELHEDDAAARASRASIALALVAALGFGSYFVGADVAADDSVLWTLFLGRVVAIPVLGTLAVARRIEPPAPRDLAQFAAIGSLDLAATGFYAIANTRGDLSIVSVVGSLYPVTTVLLARAVLSERIRRVQAVGIVLALAGVAMIAAG